MHCCKRKNGLSSYCCQDIIICFSKATFSWRHQCFFFSFVSTTYHLYETPTWLWEKKCQCFCVLSQRFCIPQRNFFFICLQNSYYLRGMQDIWERMQKQWNIIEYNPPISYFLRQHVPLGLCKFETPFHDSINSQWINSEMLTTQLLSILILNAASKKK